MPRKIVQGTEVDQLVEELMKPAGKPRTEEIVGNFIKKNNHNGLFDQTIYDAAVKLAGIYKDGKREKSEKEDYALRGLLQLTESLSKGNDRIRSLVDDACREWKGERLIFYKTPDAVVKGVLKDPIRVSGEMESVVDAIFTPEQNKEVITKLLLEYSKAEGNRAETLRDVIGMINQFTATRYKNWSGDAVTDFIDKVIYPVDQGAFIKQHVQDFIEENAFPTMTFDELVISATVRLARIYREEHKNEYSKTLNYAFMGLAYLTETMGKGNEGLLDKLEAGNKEFKRATTEGIPKKPAEVAAYMLKGPAQVHEVARKIEYGAFKTDELIHVMGELLGGYCEAGDKDVVKYEVAMGAVNAAIRDEYANLTWRLSNIRTK